MDQQQGLIEVDQVPTDWDLTQQIEGMRVALSLYSEQNNILKKKFDSISLIIKQEAVSSEEKTRKLQEIISSQQSQLDPKQSIIKMLQRQNKTLLQVLRTKLTQVCNFEKEIEQLKQKIQQLNKSNSELKSLLVPIGNARSKIEEDLKGQIDRLKKEYLVLKEENNINKQKMSDDSKKYREYSENLSLKIETLRNANQLLEQEKESWKIQMHNLQVKWKIEKDGYQLKIKTSEDLIKAAKTDESQRKIIVLRQNTYREEIIKLNRALTQKQEQVCRFQEQSMAKNIQFMTQLEEKENYNDQIQKKLIQAQLNFTDYKKKEQIERGAMFQTIHQKQGKITDLQNKIQTFEFNSIKLSGDLQQMKGQMQLADEYVRKWKGKCDQLGQQKTTLMQKVKQYKEHGANMSEQKLMQLVIALAAKMKPQQRSCFKASIIHCLS